MSRYAIMTTATGAGWYHFVRPGTRRTLCGGVGVRMVRLDEPVRLEGQLRGDGPRFCVRCLRWMKRHQPDLRVRELANFQVSDLA